MKKYTKILSANDLGDTGGHQGGVCIPKKMDGLLEFLPALDPNEYNPRADVECVGENGHTWNMQYIHYNNKILKNPRTNKYGTRNEYRITHMTKFFREQKAEVGDILEIEEIIPRKKFKMCIKKKYSSSTETLTCSSTLAEDDEVPILKLKGWRKY